MCPTFHTDLTTCTYRCTQSQAVGCPAVGTQEVPVEGYVAKAELAG